MLDVTLTICMGIICVGFLFGLWRLFKGPGTLDRILSFDYLCVCIVTLIVLRSIRSGSVDYLELVMIFSLLGFATVIVFMEAFFHQKESTDGS